MHQQPKSEWNAPDLLCDTYWKRPVVDFTRKGDPSAEKIATAVGLALSAWGNVEENLCILFGDLMSNRAPACGFMAMRVYGSVNSSLVRRDMILAAAEVYFGFNWKWDDIQNPIKSLLGAVNEASMRRDDLAHGQAIEHFYSDELLGFFWVSTSYKHTRNELKRHAPYNDVIPSDIRRYRYNGDDMTTLTSKLSELSAFILAYCDNIRLLDDDTPRNVKQIMDRGALDRVPTPSQ